eukprot:862735-Alexandrium_andersonii.AAC.1
MEARGVGTLPADEISEAAAAAGAASCSAAQLSRPSPLRGPRMPAVRSGSPTPPGPRMPVVGVVGAGPRPPSPRMPVVEGAGSRVSLVLAASRDAPR